MSQKISKTITYFSIIIVVIGAVFLVNGLILAWTPPTQAPTGGNVPAPLNVGPDAQTKTGGLTIGSLDVNGDINVGGHDVFMGAADWGIVYSPTYPNYGIFYDEGSPDKIVLSPDGGGKAGSNFVVSGSGNVGIGVTDPVSNLEIRRNDADSEITFHDPGNVWYTMGIDFSESGRPLRINYGPDPGNTNGMSITSANNIGIGTTNPGTKLEVAGDVRIRGSQLQITRPNTTGGYARGVHFRNIDGTTREAGIGMLGSGQNPPHTLYMAFGDSPWGSGVGIYVKSTGNIGIGTTNPVAKLEVNGNIIADTPTANNHVATKEYVDAQTGGGVEISGTYTVAGMDYNWICCDGGDFATGAFGNGEKTINIGGVIYNGRCLFVKEGAVGGQAVGIICLDLGTPH